MGMKSSKTDSRQSLTPQEFADLFTSKQSSAPFNGVCGRFIRGVNDHQLSMLSDEPGKKLSWICTEDLLHSILGMNPAEAMFHIGFGLDWVEERLRDGTRHRLVLFPSSAATQATWDNVFTLVRLYYGEEVYKKLNPFRKQLKSVAFEDIPGSARLRELSNLPVAEKYANPEFMTTEKFLKEEPSLYSARGFLYHSVGCNFKYTGTGMNESGQPEFLTPNKPLSEIEGCVCIDLTVTQEDIAKIKSKMN